MTDTLHCGEDMRDFAHHIVRSSARPLFVRVNEAIPPGHILGVRGVDVVLWIGPPSKEQAAEIGPVGEEPKP